MSKFKVGDRVEIRACRRLGGKITEWSWVGRSGVVCRTDDCFVGVNAVNDNQDTQDPEDWWWFHEDDVSFKEKTMDNLQVGDILVTNYDQEQMVLAVSGKLVFLSDTDDFDTAGTDQEYTVKQLKKYGYKVKGLEEEAKEMTVAEIEEKLGHPVKVVKEDE